MTTADNGSASNPSAGFFELWQETMRKSTEAWTQAAASLGGMTAPGAANPGAGPFGAFPFGFPPGAGASEAGAFAPPFNPADFMQMWQRMFESWQSQWAGQQSNAPNPVSIEEAQRQWSRYLESMAATFAEFMSTEEFAKMLGQYMEQSLSWQDRTAKQVNPQINAMLRAYNLPSRSQIDRLFARVIGIEEKLDDIEDEMRKLRSELTASRRAPSSRNRSARAAAPPAGEETE